MSAGIQTFEGGIYKLMVNKTVDLFEVSTQHLIPVAKKEKKGIWTDKRLNHK